MYQVIRYMHITYLLILQPVFYIISSARTAWLPQSLNGFESHFPYFLAAWSKGYDAWFSARKLQVQVLSFRIETNLISICCHDIFHPFLSFY